MTVVDLHPEELLEREGRGELDAEGRARLDAHVARCTTCRFERCLRADFRDDMRADVPVPRLAQEGASRDHETTRDATAPAPCPLPRGRPRPRTTWLLAAAVTLVAMSVAAADGVRGGALRDLVGSLIITTREPARERPAAPPKGPVVGTARKAEAAAKPTSAVATAESPVKVEAPEAPEATALRPPFTRTARDRDPGSANASHGSARARWLPPANEAASLFDEENSARRLGNYARVIEIHRDLEARFPSSGEAHASQATVGRLLLDRGNPSDALPKFDDYLAAGWGALRQEAIIGRALALERLGRSAEAIDAWGALLGSFPDSPYAAHAKARIESMKSP